jgi:putative ABC transport system permease protein
MNGATLSTASAAVPRRQALDIGPELSQGFENLRAHKLRSVLTMLGMIFGVAAVIAMLSIGAGAQQQVIAFIEQLGVRNVIVEAREAGDDQTLQRVRQQSGGLSFADVRAIEATVDGVSTLSPRKRFVPSKTLPRPQGDVPVLFGVSSTFQEIGGLTMSRGRFFTPEEEAAAAGVTVLGQSAATAFFGGEDPVGRYVKFNDSWFRVIGVAAPRLAVQGDVGGMPAQDSNNVAYVPIHAAIRRIEDSQAYLRDEIDAIYLRLESEDRVTTAGTLVRGLLDASHRGAGDFTVIVPAELLAQQQQTRRLFQFVMVAIASISLLVGGIGIMNIMLASVMERTREIGVRRAVGATRRDVIRQFLVETTLITVTGGVAGVIVGIVLSQLVAYLAGWSTVVTVTSVVVACVVSVSVGIIFGLYPAARAARLDPVSALHYE